MPNLPETPGYNPDIIAHCLIDQGFGHIGIPRDADRFESMILRLIKDPRNALEAEFLHSTKQNRKGQNIRTIETPSYDEDMRRGGQTVITKQREWRVNYTDPDQGAKGSDTPKLHVSHQTLDADSVDELVTHIGFLAELEDKARRELSAENASSVAKAIKNQRESMGRTVVTASRIYAEHVVEKRRAEGKQLEPYGYIDVLERLNGTLEMRSHSTDPSIEDMRVVLDESTAQAMRVFLGRFMGRG